MSGTCYLVVDEPWFGALNPVKAHYADNVQQKTKRADHNQDNVFTRQVVLWGNVEDAAFDGINAENAWLRSYVLSDPGLITRSK